MVNISKIFYLIFIINCIQIILINYICKVKKDAVDEKLNKDELPKDTTVKELELDGERNDINKESDTDSTKVNDVVLGETDQKDKIEILQNIGEKRKFIPVII